MLYIPSNMSPREALNLYGALPINTIEALIDAQEAMNNQSEIKPYLSEAKSCFAAEDCIQELIHDATALARTLRGANKAAMLELLEKMESRQLELSREGEYGTDQLNQALKAISGN